MTRLIIVLFILFSVFALGCPQNDSYKGSCPSKMSINAMKEVVPRVCDDLQGYAVLDIGFLDGSDSDNFAVILNRWLVTYPTRQIVSLKRISQNVFEINYKIIILEK